MPYHPDNIRTGNMLPDRSTDLTFDDDTLTQQQFTAECDVNNIVRSNMFQPADPSQLRFADVSEVLSYHDSFIVVQKAQQSFATLSAEVRARFNNDTSAYVEFLADPSNANEAIQLGLMPTPQPQPQKPLEQAPDAPQA
ncbi:MAG: internal scaffolding protein [Microvirus sp.]|nr:MAG: internal scaffolding protein [Microvirus sp.]